MNKIALTLLIIMAGSLPANAQDEAANMTAACIACHGVKGISTNTNWPNLAGQQVDYLIKEMTAFRDGTRSDPVMAAALLQGFDDEQIAAVAEYFSSLPAAEPDSAKGSSAGQNVRAFCVSCHGMDGTTVSSLWPNLAGQQAGYLKKQLLDYKAGRRQHPIMQVIANELSDQQIADVAEYYSQQ